jgi:hypothetical protein
MYSGSHHLLKSFAYGGGEVGPQFEQIPQGFTRRITFSELPAGGGHRPVRKPVARQIDFERETECAAVVAS